MPLAEYAIFSNLSDTPLDYPFDKQLVNILFHVFINPMIHHSNGRKIWSDTIQWGLCEMNLLDQAMVDTTWNQQ